MARSIVRNLMLLHRQTVLRALSACGNASKSFSIINGSLNTGRRRSLPPFSPEWPAGKAVPALVFHYFDGLASCLLTQPTQLEGFMRIAGVIVGMLMLVAAPAVADKGDWSFIASAQWLDQTGDTEFREG